jgi:hypothetical protein
MMNRRRSVFGRGRCVPLVGRGAPGASTSPPCSSTHARVTVRGFWQEWTTDPLRLRPADSTNLHNAGRTRAFVDVYGERPIRAIDDEIVREYRRSGSLEGTILALRAFFNDAARADAGRLVNGSSSPRAILCSASSGASACSASASIRSTSSRIAWRPGVRRPLLRPGGRPTARGHER